MGRKEAAYWLDRHYETMRRTAFRSAPPQDAEDALHNACVSILSKEIDVSALANPAWMRSVVRFAALTLYGKAHRKRETLSAPNDLPDVAVPAVQEWAADIEKFRATAQQLSLTDQKSFALSVFGEMTPSEVARHLRVTWRTAAVSADRSRARLLSLLRSPDEEETGIDLYVGRSTKLSSDQARDIFKRAQGGEDQTSIASEFGVSQKTISEIKNKKTWKHIHND